MKSIKIGLIGAGGNTRTRHIPGFQALENVEIISVANRSQQSSMVVAKEFGIPSIAKNWREIIENSEIDAVCIGTWPYMHCPITLEALNNGKHVLCEARMALNSFEAHKMLETSRKNPHLIAQIVPAPHTLELDRTISNLIGSGFIGDLISMDGRINSGSDYPDFNSTPHWRQDRDFSGNNIMNMGIWYEAIMRWLGPVSSVFALGQSIVSYRIDENGDRVNMSIPDHVDITGQFVQGGHMRLTVSSVIGLSPAEVDLFIFGTEGTLRILQNKGSTLELYGGDKKRSTLEKLSIRQENKGHWRVEEEFINSILGEEEITHTDFTTAVRYMEWTDAVTQSIQTGRSINLPLLQ
ncbi:MAG: hypothetical protein CMM58_11770 [Rhodospirillaceae bacterium]|nr:hypothetical protein [Rhodospirillaceae bacterium]|tara:strand:+ start:2926 stop:3981 length:1056 start_codon:yes stop_codon:yes gene_type:complete